MGKQSALDETGDDWTFKVGTEWILSRSLESVVGLHGRGPGRGEWIGLGSLLGPVLMPLPRRVLRRLVSPTDHVA